MLIKLRNTTLQVKISFAFILMTILIMALLGGIFYSNMTATLKAAKQKELANISMETANKIERFLFERSGDIKVLSESRLLSSPEVSDQTKLFFLNNVMQTYKTYNGIFVLDQDGKVVLSVGLIPDFRKIVPELTGNSAYISSLMSNSDGSKILLFSRPLLDATGSKVGTVAECMQLDAIEEIIQNVTIGESGFSSIEIIDQSGISYNYEGKTIEAEALSGYLAETGPITNLEPDQSRWLVSVYQEKQEAYKVIADFRTYLMVISVVIILLFSFLSIILSRIITEPVRQLMDKMNQLIGGNRKSARSDLIKDEISSLTLSFDLLLEQLNFLMQMVLEKTGEAAYMGEIDENIRELFETIPNGIITIDAKGQLTSANKSAAQILNLNGEGPLELSIFDDAVPELHDFFSILANGLKNERKYRGEIMYIPDGHGTSIPIIFNTLRQTDQNGELIGMTVIMNHLEEKRRLEESILRAKRLSELGEMAAGVAHEIRNPLAAIKGYAQFARRNYTEGQQTYRDLSVILDEVDRLDLIVERFMGFALPNKPEKRWIIIEDLIEETVHLLKSDFLKARVGLRLITSAKTRLFIDPGQIKQVLINIIINAIQASRAGEDIAIKTTMDGDAYFTIEIIDRGDGIKDEVLDKVFTPFFTTKEKGTGLGLSISSRIIQNHDGALEIDRTVKPGVRILIKLPLKGDRSHES